MSGKIAVTSLRVPVASAPSPKARSRTTRGQGSRSETIPGAPRERVR